MEKNKILDLELKNLKLQYEIEKNNLKIKYLELWEEKPNNKIWFNFK